MKQILKRIIQRSQTGQSIWKNLSDQYHKVRRAIKHAIQKRKDFNLYVYPAVGRHPTKNDVFLVLSPTYRNLGDHAIAKAEKDILNEWGIHFKEVTIDVIQTLAKHNDYSVFGCGTVLVTGGGFLGTLWPHMHMMTSRMIEDNPKAKIVIMPNTFYYDQTPEGEVLFESDLNVFNRPNVKRIYLRERISYNKLCGKYKTIKLMPDMVLSLNESRSGIKRSGCLICLRNDKEQTLDQSGTATVFRSMKQLFGNNVNTTDMRNAVDVPLDERLEKLNQKFDQFRHAELVITDRLHGMIFSAITGTPCIVLNSRSHKLAGCYEWLKNLTYIQFCDNAEDICNIYARMPHEGQHYDEHVFDSWFDEMKKELISIIEE